MQKERLPLSVEEIRLLVALYRSGQLTKAAEEIGISVSAASRQLNRARENLSDSLFIRSTSGYTPTVRMQLQIDRMRRILDDLTALGETDEFAPEKLDLTVRIMSADSGFLIFLTKAIRAIRPLAPKLKFEIQPLSSDMFQRLKDGDTDLLIMPRSRPPVEYSQMPLASLAVAALVRASHPLVREAGSHGELPFGAFARYSLIDVDPTNGLDGFNFKFHANNVSPVSITVPYFGTAASLLDGSDDFLLVPAAAAHELSAGRNLRIIRIAGKEAPTFTTNLIWHRRIHENPAMQWIRAQILTAQKSDC